MNRSVRVYYGIDPRNLTVEQFWLSRGKRLTGMHRGTAVSHYVLPLHDAVSELQTVYRLTDIVELHPMRSLWENHQVQALEDKASALRAGRKASE